MRKPPLIRWSPKVLTRTDQDYIIEYKGADELPHYSGVTQKDLQTDNVFTLANGEVVIPLQVLRRAAAGKGTLRELAYALDHEGVHVADKVTLTEAGTRKDAEVRAYEHGMKRAKDYGYPDDSIPRWHRDQWEIRVDSEAARPVYPGPVDELKMKKVYESQQAELKAIRKHQDALKQTVEGNYLVKTARDLAYKACDGHELQLGQDPLLHQQYGPSDAVDKALAAAPNPGPDGFSDCGPALYHDILQSIVEQGGASHSFINRYAKRRRVEARWNLLQKEAKACDFKIQVRSDAVIGIQESSSPETHLTSYSLANSGDFDALRVGMLIANACLYVTKYPYAMDRPSFKGICNPDAFQILDKRRDDPILSRFVGGMDADWDRWDQKNCIVRVLSRLEAPVSSKSFQAAVKNAKKLHDKEVKARSDAEKRARRIEEENRRIEEREQRRRERTPQPGDPDCLPINRDSGIIGCRRER